MDQALPTGARRTRPAPPLSTRDATVSAGLRVEEIGLLGWSALMGVVAAIMVSFAPGAWYAQRSASVGWAAPGWLFAPLSMALYVALALGAWLVWKDARERTGAGVAFGLLGTQLVLDVLWPWLFFALHRVDLALLDAGLLALVSAGTTAFFWRRKRAAGWLVAPSLLRALYLAAMSWQLWLLGGA